MNIFFTGFVKFKDENHPYCFENGKLTIMPVSAESLNYSDIEWFKDLNYKQNGWLDKLLIEGITGDKKRIFFFFTDNNSYQNGNYVYDVEYVYACDYKDGLNIDGIKIKSREINYFYNLKTYLKQDYQLDGKTFSKYSFELNSHPDCDFGKFRFHDYSVSLKGSMSWEKENDTYSPVQLFSLLIMELSRKTYDLDKIYELVCLVKSVFRFLCYRKNIVFDEIKTFLFTDDHFRKEIGTFYLFDSEIQEELSKKATYQIITSDEIENSISNIFSLEMCDILYHTHISDSFYSISIYTPQRMLSILIAFEHYFSKLFPDVNMVSEEFKIAQTDVINYLEAKISETHGKQKEKYKSIKRSISKINDSYMSNLKKALEDNYNCLVPFIKKIYNVCKDEDVAKVIEDCSSRSNKIRNKMAHGKLDIDFSTDNLHDIKLIELLIYSMVLKYVEVDETIIIKKIASLFNYTI